MERADCGQVVFRVDMPHGKSDCISHLRALIENIYENMQEKV